MVWSWVYKRDSEETLFGLFQRTYFMDGALAKISSQTFLPLVACVDSINMWHICIWQNKKRITCGFFE